MPRIRRAVTGIALASAVLFNVLACSQAREPTAQQAPAPASLQLLPPPPPLPPPVAPPAEWAEYVAQVRAAEQVQGDEARCKAYPDLPGNQWRTGAAQGRCSLLRAPVYTLDQIDALLDTQEGVAQLERTFATLLDAHYRDQAQREQIFIAFIVFDETPRAGEVAQRWAKAAPGSGFAHVAVGSHYDKAGWMARGGGFASQTSDRQFESMAGYFAEAIPAYKRAMKIEPRLSVACYGLSAIGRQVDDALQKTASSHCRKVDPDSYYVALDHITAAMPKWGGSEKELRDAVAYAAARTKRNPILGALLGDEVSYRPLAAPVLLVTREVSEELGIAVRLGVNGATFARAAYAATEAGDYWTAFALHSQSIRFWPDDPDRRFSRARVLADTFHDYAWARSDMEVVMKDGSDDPGHNFLMGSILEAVETPASARPHFRRAMEEPWRWGAMERYCQTFVTPVVMEEADACIRELLAEYPDSALALFLRAKVLASRDAVAALAEVEDFRRRANPIVHERALAESVPLEAMLKAQLPAAKRPMP